MAAVASHLEHRHIGPIAEVRDEVRATGPEIASLRPFVRQRQLARNRDQRIVVLVRSRQRHRTEKALRIGMAHRSEHVPHAARFDGLAGIHDRDGIAGLEDQTKIVRDEERRRPGARGQVLDQRDDAGFDRHVERGRRLVEDQEARVRQERHGDDDALLLAAGELMRIGAHDALGVGQAHGLDHVERSCARLLLRDFVVDQRHFHQLPVDQHGWVERGHRLLVDHRDFRAAKGAQLLAGERGHVAAVEADRAAGDFAGAGQIAHHRERDRRFAAAEFADEPHRLAGHDLAGEIHHRRNFAGAGEERDAEAVDFEDRFGHFRLPQSRNDCSRIASASRFRPSTKDIIASAGARAG